MTYDQPDKASKFAPSDHDDPSNPNDYWTGKLFLIWPISVEVVNFKKDNGEVDPTDVVTADVAIIDLTDPQTGKPTYLENARIGGKALTPQLKTRIGRKVLGRMTKGQKQPGKNPAFYVADFTPQDAAYAEQYEQAFPRASKAYEAPSGAVPAPAAAPPAPPSWLPQQPQQAAPVAPTWGQQPLPQAPAVPPAPQQQWGQQPAAPAAPTPQAAPWPDGLADFLQSRGINTAGMTVDVAKQIAATLPA